MKLTVDKISRYILGLGAWGGRSYSRVEAYGAFVIDYVYNAFKACFTLKNP